MNSDRTFYSNYTPRPRNNSLISAAKSSLDYNYKDKLPYDSAHQELMNLHRELRGSHKYRGHGQENAIYHMMKKQQRKMDSLINYQKAQQYQMNSQLKLLKQKVDILSFRNNMNFQQQQPFPMQYPMNYMPYNPIPQQIPNYPIQQQIPIQPQPIQQIIPHQPPPTIVESKVEEQIKLKTKKPVNVINNNQRKQVRKRIRKHFFAVAFTFFFTSLYQKSVMIKKQKFQHFFFSIYQKAYQDLKINILNYIARPLDNIYKDQQQQLDLFKDSLSQKIKNQRLTAIKQYVDEILSGFRQMVQNQMPNSATQLVSLLCQKHCFLPNQYYTNFELQKMPLSQIAGYLLSNQKISIMLICSIFIFRLLIADILLQPVKYCKRQLSNPQKLQSKLKLISGAIYYLCLTQFYNPLQYIQNNYTDYVSSSDVIYAGDDGSEPGKNVIVGIYGQQIGKELADFSWNDSIKNELNSTLIKIYNKGKTLSNKRQKEHKKQLFT